MPCVPSLAFLAEIESKFAVEYPEAFRAYCRTTPTRIPTRGAFICDQAMFDKYAQQLWGMLLPFFVDGDDVYGFALEPTTSGALRVSDTVVVFSIHTIVHSFADFSAFLSITCGQVGG